jgi:hypothetical protein
MPQHFLTVFLRHKVQDCFLPLPSGGPNKRVAGMPNLITGLSCFGVSFLFANGKGFCSNG